MQNNQCLGGLVASVKHCKIIDNKVISLYLCIKSIDLVESVEYLPIQDQESCIKLLSKWTTVFLRNKFDVELTEEMCKTHLSSNEPITSFIPRRTRAIIDAINEGVKKLEKARFIKLSTSPYAMPTICVRKPNETL